ncbi:DUF1775 domain-containing protein (plasmid) [Arthrobacter sp. TES]|nr:DUF1775 domain-containing protein [Arthrobacter sp. TES]
MSLRSYRRPADRGLASASAHVTVNPSTTDAGAFSVLTFAASHGCEGSPTTSFTISIPDTIADAKPTVYPGWEMKKVEEELAEPVTAARQCDHHQNTSARSSTRRKPRWRTVTGPPSKSRSRTRTKPGKPWPSLRCRPVRRAKPTGPNCSRKAWTRTSSKPPHRPTR